MKLVLKYLTASGLTSLLLVTSQASAFDPSKGFSGQNVGEISGAVAGGVGGNYLARKSKLGKTGQIAATIGGTIVGGYLGGTLGKTLDARSRARADSAQLTAVSTGARQTWESPSRAGAASGNGNSGYGSGAPAGQVSSGSVQPGHPYQTESGICRDYTHTVVIGGRQETARGIACRNPDGTWRYAG